MAAFGTVAPPAAGVREIATFLADDERAGAADPIVRMRQGRIEDDGRVIRPLADSGPALA